LFEITKIGEFFQSSKHCIIFIHNVLWGCYCKL